MSYKQLKSMGILVLFVLFLAGCSSLMGLLQPSPSPEEPQASPVPAYVIQTEDQDYNSLLNILKEIESYIQDAENYSGEIEIKVDTTLDLIETCKGPVNFMEPFMYVTTIIEPHDVLYMGYSFNPCDFYLKDANIALGNASNHMDYVNSIYNEASSAFTLVSRACKDNGMSPQFKAIVSGSINALKDKAKNEILKLKVFEKDLKGFLNGYIKCMNL